MAGRLLSTRSEAKTGLKKLFFLETGGEGDKGIKKSFEFIPHYFR